MTVPQEYKMLRVSKRLHQRIKMLAAQNGKTLSDTLEELVSKTIELPVIGVRENKSEGPGPNAPNPGPSDHST
jgi:hypothetical protein